MARHEVGGVDVDEAGEVMRGYLEQARETVQRLAEELELERRIQESPLAVLGVAAAAGFVLGGGLWPVLRPFARSALRTALAPANLIAIGAAIGAMRAGASEERDRERSPSSRQSGEPLLYGHQHRIGRMLEGALYLYRSVVGLIDDGPPIHDVQDSQGSPALGFARLEREVEHGCIDRCRLARAGREV